MTEYARAQVSKFKIGDRVRWAGEGEPIKGEVTKLLGADVYVKWSNGTTIAYADHYLNNLAPADPQTAEPRPKPEGHCVKCGNWFFNLANHIRDAHPEGAAAQANQGARPLWKRIEAEAVGSSCSVDVSKWDPMHVEWSKEAHRIEADNERLRKELDDLRPRVMDAPVFIGIDWADGEGPCCKDARAALSKLREFSEGQARQIAGLERVVGEVRDANATANADADEANRRVGKLTRELEKLKRARK